MNKSSDIILGAVERFGDFMPSPLRIFPDVEKNKQALVDIDDIVWDESLDNHIKASRIRKIIASLTEAPHA